MEEKQFQEQMAEITKRNKRKNIILIGFVLFLVAILIIVVNKSDKSASNMDYTHIDSSETQKATIDSVTILFKIDSLNQQIEKSIKKNFKVPQDEFDKVIRFNSKDYSTYINYRSLLEVTVFQDGSFAVETNYNASDWIFHTHILVSIKGIVIESPIIPTYSDNHNSKVYSGGIWESIWLTEDNGIVQFIAENYKENIKVRLEGEDWYKDKVLSTKVKNNIKNAFELSEMIKKRNKLNSSLISIHSTY